MKHDHVIDHETYEQLVKGPCGELRNALKEEIKRISSKAFAGGNIVRYADMPYPISVTYNFLIKPEAVREMVQALLKLIDEK